MEVGTTQIVALIGTFASVLCTVIVGALSFFMKKTLTGLEEADKKNTEQIAKVDEKNTAQIAKLEDKFNDLKADLPLIYVTREDYIRIMNRVEEKLDKILFSSGTAKGKEE